MVNCKADDVWEIIEKSQYAKAYIVDKQNQRVGILDYKALNKQEERAEFRNSLKSVKEHVFKYFKHIPYTEDKSSEYECILLNIFHGTDKIGGRYFIYFVYWKGKKKRFNPIIKEIDSSIFLK